MKILHIAPTPFFSDRGCHIRILGEIRALQENGAEVLLSTYHLGRNIENIKVFRTIKIPWYKKIDAGGSWHKLYIDIFLFLLSIKIVFKFKPSILHGHLHEGALIAKFVSWLTSFGKIHVVFDVQGSLTGELNTYGMLGKKGFMYKAFILLEKLICRLPDYIVCSSKSNKDFIINEMGIAPQKVSELIDGIYSNYFHNVDNKQLKKILNINEEKVVVYSGSLLGSKGINYLIESIPEVVKNYNGVKFLIIGYPVEPIRERAIELKIENYIIFFGRIDFFKLPDYLSIADIAVDPKIDKAGEGSGKIVNYMGAGLPIVCFESPNNFNFLGENGIYAKPADTKDLCKKILFLLNNENQSKEIGSLNKKRAIELFSWNTKGKDLLNIYHQLLN